MENVKVNHEMKSVLAKRIVTSKSLTGCIVYGGHRIGKSSYCLQVMYDIYGNWDDVLKYTFFKITDLTKALRQAIKENYLIPCILLDDAGVGGSKMLYFTDKNLTMYLGALFDVMGTSVKGILFSTPNPDQLLKSLRGYEFYRVKIIKANSQYDRIANGYGFNMLPSGDRRVSREFKDPFNAIIPDNEAYAKYIKIRKSYLDVALDDLDRATQSALSLKEQGEDMGIIQ